MVHVSTELAYISNIFLNNIQETINNTEIYGKTPVGDVYNKQKYNHTHNIKDSKTLLKLLEPVVKFVRQSILKY